MNQIFERARSFMYRNARPIDLARWKLHFEGGSPEEILSCLAAYQNPDGGFGHGLECDALNPESSPMQSWSATTYLRLIDMYDPAHPIVAGLLRYLTSGRDFDGHRWAYSVASNNDHPHAPWWHYDAAAPRFDYNPTAALAGYMLRASEPGSAANDLARRIAREAFDWAMERELPGEMHLLPGLRTLCWDVMTVCPELFDAGALLERIERRMVELVVEDADKWDSEYCAMPSNFIMGPQDNLLVPLGELAMREADWLLAKQEADGAWPITWSWGEESAAFHLSASYWRGGLIFKNLFTLLGAGKITI